jgi:hypothetical protein
MWAITIRNICFMNQMECTPTLPHQSFSLLVENALFCTKTLRVLKLFKVSISSAYVILLCNAEKTANGHFKKGRSKPLYYILRIVINVDSRRAEAAIWNAPILQKIPINTVKGHLFLFS